MRTIQVQTPSANYPVYVGSNFLPNLSRHLQKLTGKTPQRRLFLLTSPEIWSLWGPTLLTALPERQHPTVLFLPPGETHKRLSQVERLATEMAAAGADRSSLLLAFGGGIVGDVGGFLAAIYMRGIDYIQMPTTFLSQVDSSVGGKTGTNLATGKNLIGSFHHPLAVFADIGVLSTLSDREFRAGLFESVKAGIIRDPKLFRFIENNIEAILRRDTPTLEYVIGASIRMKADVVHIDERENGLRMILNYGHTLGHAIEAATGYRKLLHGEAVAWGMLAALHIARSRATVMEKEAARIEQTIHAFGPLPSFRATADALLDASGRDKKNRSGKRRFILPQGIGNSIVVEDVTEAELHSAIAWTLTTARQQKPVTEAAK